MRKPIDLDLAFSLLNEGLSLKEVAKKMNVNYPNLSSKMTKYKKKYGKAKIVIPIKRVDAEFNGNEEKIKIEKEDTLRDLVYNLSIILTKGLIQKCIIEGVIDIGFLSKSELRLAGELIKMQVSSDKNLEKVILMNDVSSFK